MHLFKPSFPIETERLHLRPYEEADEDWLYDMRQLKENLRYVSFGGEPREAIQEILAMRMAMRELVAPGDRIMLVMVMKESGARAGEFMLFDNPAHQGACEIGFALHPDYHGQGLVNEAGRALMKMLFGTGDYHRIIGICDAENASSRAALARLGLSQEALFRKSALIGGEWRDQNVFAVLKDEWPG